MIDLQNVVKRYGRRTALADVSLRIDPGRVTVLLGANGAGKSTLLRCLLGVTDFEGRIRVGGLDPLTNGPQVRAAVGYMPQSGGLHAELTVTETVALYAAIRGVAPARGQSLIDDAGLAGHAGTRIGELSGGLRQRLGFALALLTDPAILMLDEPSASLDASSRAWLAARLRDAAAQGRTVIVSTHGGQELLATADRRIVLEDGRVAADEPVVATVMRRAPHPYPNTARTRGSALPLLCKEAKDAVTNRWLITYAVLLGLLGIAAAATGIQSSSGLALQAFGRTTATLMNLCLLLAPLVAVLMGALSIAGERDRGTLEHLLAQPLSRTSVLLAKHAGLLSSLTAATVAGFVPAGVLIVWHGGPGTLTHYLLFPAIASLTAAALLAIGVLVSVSSRTAAQSQGAAIFVWFAFVLLYDLLLIGVLAVSGMPVELLAAALVANPVDAARVFGVLSLEPDLYLLGPAGVYLTARFSGSGAARLLLAALLVWSTAPLALAAHRFSLPRQRRRMHLLRRSRAHGRQTGDGHGNERGPQPGVRLLPG